MTRRKFYNSNAPVISRLLSVLQLRLLGRILPFKASNASLDFVEQTRRSGKIIINVLAITALVQQQQATRRGPTLTEFTHILFKVFELVVLGCR